MEEVKNGFPPDFQVEEAAYQKVLGSQPQVSTSLPAWETSSDRWSEMLESWQRWIEDLINRYIKPETKIDLNWINWEVLFIGVGILILASVIAIILYLIARYWRGRSEDYRFRFKEEKLAVSTRESRLVEMIKEKMANGEWAVATKLRWRLFLERKRMSVEMTPLEFESQTRAAPLPSAFEQYQNMFSEGSVTQAWYQSYSQKLRDLEGPQ